MNIQYKFTNIMVEKDITSKELKDVLDKGNFGIIAVDINPEFEELINKLSFYNFGKKDHYLLSISNVAIIDDSYRIMLTDYLPSNLRDKIRYRYTIV